MVSNSPFEYTIGVLNEYLEGKIDKIEELEYAFIEEIKDVYSFGKNVAFYSNLKSTGV